jgi:hypothetical protein
MDKWIVAASGAGVARTVGRPGLQRSIMMVQRRHQMRRCTDCPSSPAALCEMTLRNVGRSRCNSAVQERECSTDPASLH